VRSIKISKRAEHELFDACDWYEKQQQGLSAKLIKELGSSLRRIESRPLLYAKRYDTELRFIVVKKFPFVIVFRFDEDLDTIFVLSVFNTHRNPKEFT
jgi:plasmid stabilization system protein ParE